MREVSDTCYTLRAVGLLELFTYGMIYLCQLGRHLLLSYLKLGYMSTTLKNWIVTLKPIELEPGKLFVLTVVQ